MCMPVLRYLVDKVSTEALLDYLEEFKDNEQYYDLIFDELRRRGTFLNNNEELINE